MLTTERRRRLLDEITRVGHLVTSEAAVQLGVSEVTIRSDLDDLERRGRLVRTHGGAVMQKTAAGVRDFEARRLLHNDAKHRIALAARQFVHNNQTIIFDAGSTILHLAEVMPEVSELTIYTPGITTARQLLTVEGVSVRLMGGRADARLLETIGSPQEQGIQDLLAHTLFLGAQGVDGDLDIVEQSSDLATGKQNLARRARFVVFLIDSSKWTHSALTKVMPLDRVDVVITDDGIEVGTRRRLESLDLELIVA